MNQFIRGVDPKVVLNLGRAAKIHNFFKDLDIQEKEYEITPTKIIFKTSLFILDKNIAELPDGLTISGNLFLSNLPIKKLPSGLTINGSLYISCTGITKFPDDLYVKKQISIGVKQIELDNFIPTSKFAHKIGIV